MRYAFGFYLAALALPLSLAAPTAKAAPFHKQQVEECGFDCDEEEDGFEIESEAAMEELPEADAEADGEPEEEDSQEAGETDGKRKLEAEILPAFFFDFSYGRKVLNLTPASSARKALELGNYRNGFRVEDEVEMEGGIGPSVAFHYENATGLAAHIWTQVGLIPAFSRAVETVRYARNFSALNSMKKKFRLPRAASDLRTWSPGDAISYGTEGGIIFFVGGGALLPASIAAAAMATGSFQIYIEKLDHDHAYVKITEGKVRSLGLQAGAEFVSLGTTRFRSLSQGLSFRVNLRST